MENDPSPGQPIAVGDALRAGRRRARVAQILTAGSMVVALSASAHAAAPVDTLPSVTDDFGGVVQEQDVALVFGYLRGALSAAVTGREPPSVGPLVERADAIGKELARRSAISGRVVLDAIENAVRESLKETPRLPPASPLQRTGY